MHFLSLLFTFIIIIVYAAPKKIRQRQYAFICNLQFSLSYIFLCIYFVDNHFILLCLVLSWLQFDFQLRVWKIFTKEKLPFEQRNYKVSSKRIDGWRSLFNVSNFVKRGIKILDILGLSNAVRQQQQRHQNGAHDWVAHSTRKSQHTQHTHTQSEIHLQMQIHMFVCLSICIYNYFVLPSGFFPQQRQR